VLIGDLLSRRLHLQGDKDACIGNEGSENDSIIDGQAGNPIELLGSRYHLDAVRILTHHQQRHTLVA